MVTFQTRLVLLIVLFSAPLFLAAAPKGTVVCWGYEVGDNASPSSLKILTIAGEPLTNAIAVAAGDLHALALRSDGTVVGWGVNNYGQATGYILTNSDRSSGVVRLGGQVLSNVVAIAASGDHCLALKQGGTVVSWGSHLVPTGLSNMAAIATSYNYSLGVMRDGTVLFLGGGNPVFWRAVPDHTEADYTKIFVGLGNSRKVPGLSNVVAVAIAASASFGSMALTRDGRVVQMSLEGELTGLELQSNVVAICGGHDGLALKKDGTVVGWGPAGDVPVGLSNVVAIAGGPHHSLALKKDGTVTMWGGYRVKELAVPAGLSNVVSVAVGHDFFMTITNHSAFAAEIRH